MLERRKKKRRCKYACYKQNTVVNTCTVGTTKVKRGEKLLEGNQAIPAELPQYGIVIQEEEVLLTRKEGK